MTKIHEVEETLNAVAMLLTTYGPDNPDVHQVAKAVEPIVDWHQAYSVWQQKCHERSANPDTDTGKRLSGLDMLRQRLAKGK